MSIKLQSKSTKVLSTKFTTDSELNSKCYRSKSLKRKLIENKNLKDEDPTGKC